MRISITLTDEQYDFIKTKASAANKSISGYVRSETLKNKTEPAPCIKVTYPGTEKRLCVRVSPSEQNILDNNAQKAGLNVSDFIREKCVYESNPAVIKKNRLEQVLNDLSAQQDSLNKIVKALEHDKSTVASQQVMPYTLATIAAVDALYKQLETYIH